MGLDQEDEIVRAAQGIVLEEDAGLSQTEPEEDFKPRSNKRNATSQGRRKIDIEFIDVRPAATGPDPNLTRCYFSCRTRQVGSHHASPDAG
jgi:hypothetical protein